MADPRPILYGVSDYALMRKKNAWFIGLKVSVTLMSPWTQGR